MGRKSSLPSYLKHTASGQARCILNGKTHYLGPYGSPSSKVKYDQLLAEWLASGRSSSFGLGAQTTMTTLMIGYLRYCDGHYPVATNSEAALTRYALRPVAKLYADLPAAEFGTQQFKVIRDEFLKPQLDKRMRKKGEPPQTINLSRGYINAHMKRIARMFRWGAEEGLVSAEVYNTLRLVKSLQRGRTTAPEPEDVKPVAESLVLATLPHLPPIVADMVRVQLLAGCRPAEVCKLTPGMIDRSADVWVAKFERHKTSHHGRDRRLFFGPQAQAILAPYLVDRPDDRPLFSPMESQRRRIAKYHALRRTPANSGNTIGTNRKESPKKKPGDQYTTQSYARAIRTAAIKAKLAHWSPNQLRHTAATKLRAQFGIDIASTILGHSRLEVTQVYAEKDYQAASDVMRTVG